ncbi:MAG: hypothetical protein ACKVI4_15195 [Actinomycetales bacterium]
MSARPKPTAQPPPGGIRFALGEITRRHDEPPAATGNALRTVAESPYNDRRHLTPKQYEDHDGGPWNDTPQAVPQFVKVPNKWIVGPTLGAATPALCLFPRRNSDKISFAPDVHLQFQTVWTPIVARFSQLFLVDVDKKGNMPSTNQKQHWVCTFRGKTDTGITSIVIRIRVNNTGDQLEGWACYLPDTDYVQSFVNFPAPPAAQAQFQSDNAVVVNGALTTYNNVNGGVVVALESQLDNEVERPRRVERASQAWDLFIRCASTWLVRPLLHQRRERLTHDIVPVTGTSRSALQARWTR